MTSTENPQTPESIEHSKGIFTLPPLTVEGEEINFSVEKSTSHSNIFAAVATYMTLLYNDTPANKNLLKDHEQANYNELFNSLTKLTKYMYLTNFEGYSGLILQQCRNYVDESKDDPHYEWLKKTVDFAKKNPPRPSSCGTMIQERQYGQIAPWRSDSELKATLFSHIGGAPASGADFGDKITLTAKEKAAKDKSRRERRMAKKTKQAQRKKSRSKK